MRLIQNDKLSSYEELIEKEGSVPIQSSITIKIFQIKHGQSRKIVTDIVTQTKQEYNFRQNHDFRIPFVITVSYIFLCRP